MMKQNTTEIHKDSIIAEVHAIREEILDFYNGDVGAMLKDIRKEQAESGKKVIERLNSPRSIKSKSA